MFSCSVQFYRPDNTNAALKCIVKSTLTVADHDHDLHTAQWEVTYEALCLQNNGKDQIDQTVNLNIAL